MFKGQEGATLAMLSLTVVFLLLTVFATIMIVFDSGLFTINEPKETTQNTDNHVVEEQAEDINQPINRTEAINVNQ